MNDYLRNAMLIVLLVWLFIWGISLLYNYIEDKSENPEDPYPTEDNFFEHNTPDHNDRDKIIEEGTWGTLEKELEKIGITNFTYTDSEESTEGEYAPKPKNTKVLTGKINKNISFEVKEDIETNRNVANNLIFTIDGVEINATDQTVINDDNLYLSSNGAIILTEEQIDCIKYLKKGGEIKQEPILSYEGMAVKNWL